MGGEHKPCMFYGFISSIKYIDTTYEFTAPRTPADEILYYCHALPESASLEDIQSAIAKYEAENGEQIAAFNDFAKSKGKQARWMLGLWGNVYCNWYRNEGEEDE